MVLIGECIVALFVIAVLWYYFIRNDGVSVMLENVPGPYANPIFGCALDFSGPKDIIPTLRKYLKDHGEIIKVRLGPGDYYIFFTDADLLEQLLSSNSFIEKSKQYNFFHRWLGLGLLTSGGMRWRTKRKMLTPAFHFNILDKFINLFEQPTKVFLNKLMKHDGKEKFDVYAYVNLFSLDIICETAMGTSINAQENENSEYVEAIREMGRIIMERGFSAVKQNELIYKMFPTYQTEKKCLKIIHDYSNMVIEKRKRELEHSLNKDNTVNQYLEKKEKIAFMDLLLTAKNSDGSPMMTDNEIREEVDTFMFEGHDTVSSSISFTLYLLSNHAEIQEKIWQEQKDLFGDEKNPSVTHSDLQNMTYLNLVIKESLRIYPSVPLIGRTLQEDFKFKNYVFPKGVELIVFTHEIHRNPKYFSEPEKFIPERFLGRNEDPFTYIPFSAGPRNCIGQKFAILELKYVLSAVLRNFKLRPANEEPILLAETILKSENGIKIKLEKRD